MSADEFEVVFLRLYKADATDLGHPSSSGCSMDCSLMSTTIAPIRGSVRALAVLTRRASTPGASLLLPCSAIQRDESVALVSPSDTGWCVYGRDGGSGYDDSVGCPVQLRRTDSFSVVANMRTGPS